VRVAEKEFVAELGKLASPRTSVPTIVQHKVLGLLQSWADAFRGQAEMVTIHGLYQTLRLQGVEFPAQDLDTLAPIYTPNRVRIIPNCSYSYSVVFVVSCLCLLVIVVCCRTTA
jgi:hypothetical protein